MTPLDAPPGPDMQVPSIGVVAFRNSTVHVPWEILWGCFDKVVVEVSHAVGTWQSSFAVRVIGCWKC